MKSISLSNHFPTFGIIIALLVLSFFSCRSTKEISETLHLARRQEYIGSHGRQIQDFTLIDSVHRRWYFMSDSSFYYHPDSGLYSRGGVLSILEQGVKNQQLLSRRDSSFQSAAESVEFHVLSHYLKKASRHRWVIIICFLLALACSGAYFYLRRRTK